MLPRVSVMIPWKDESTMRRTAFFTLILALAGCAAETMYDPDWEANAPIAGGKADGLLDILPALSFDGNVSGDVGGNRSELYVIDLQRMDRIELEMTVTSGNLNPHLSFFWGTSTYVGSESWERDGDTLRKTYVAEGAGKYLVAVRAYEGEGDGGYRVSARCLGGPCAGEFPEPEPGDEYDVESATDCIAKARRCSFERLPAYNGAVGAVRARQIFTGCLESVSLSDGTSCARACEYEGDPTTTYDDGDAAGFCEGIQEMLIFYADQTPACLGVLDGCIGDCYDNFGSGYIYSERGDFGYTAESLCLSTGFNGNCDRYARRHTDCGGDLLPDSGALCAELCQSTIGAPIDDLDTLCSSDSDCESYCDVDFGAAGAECGAWGPDTQACYDTWLESRDAWICEDVFRDGGVES